MRDEILDIILKIDSLSKQEIVQLLKTIILKKDQQERESIFENAVISNTCCLPSICISNCDDCETTIDSKVDVGMV